MLTITEKIEAEKKMYYKTHFLCPACHTEFPLINSIYHCIGCHRSIIDVKLILDNPKFALRYHFGFVKEIGV
jgi:hypothetical protein